MRDNDKKTASSFGSAFTGGNNRAMGQPSKKGKKSSKRFSKVPKNDVDEDVDCSDSKKMNNKPKKKGVSPTPSQTKKEDPEDDYIEFQFGNANVTKGLANAAKKKTVPSNTLHTGNGASADDDDNESDDEPPRKGSKTNRPEKRNSGQQKSKKKPKKGGR